MLPIFLGVPVLLTAIFASACSRKSSEEEISPARENPSFEPAPRLKDPGPSRRVKPPSACPEQMVPVDRFCIDRYEAHLRVEGALHPQNQRPPHDRPYLAASSANEFPQGYISKEEAERACHQAAKRLCTLEEWLRACKGRQGLLYSYGNVEEKSRCNKGKPHLMLLRFKDKDPALFTYEDFNSPLLNATPGFFAQSGEYHGCASDEGVYDMVGNLHEWVSDNLDFTLPQKIHLNSRLEKKYRENYGFGIFMGGFYSTTHEHGAGCEFITIGHKPTYHDYSTGFRCCKAAAMDREN